MKDFLRVGVGRWRGDLIYNLFFAIISYEVPEHQSNDFLFGEKDSKIKLKHGLNFDTFFLVLAHWQG